MKCVAVSDFHLRDIETPPADLLIVAGDMTMKGSSSELEWFADWLKKQPQKHKVWIAGNHDLGIESDPSIAESIADKTGSIYLNDSMTEIEGVRIWGSPITPTFFSWAFMADRGAPIRKHWQKIPEQLDILITHGPPFGVLDTVAGGEHVGCEELYETITTRLANPPRYHIFGHIHESHGRTRLDLSERGGIELINASICDLYYRPKHPVMTFEV